MDQPPLDYRAAVDFILGFADFERSSADRRQAEAFALDRITSLLNRSDRPQDGRVTVHIAGSKGKGSTAAMVEAILRAAGYRTGLFTSPHLDAFTERIRIDGRPLRRAAFAGLVEQLKPVIAQELADDPGRISTFEILTVMGFLAFREAEVDVQVIEVGLGGRLDSTNVFREKAIAAITALSYEHTEVLGDSLTSIAWEKAGIITAATQAAVLAPQRSQEAAALIREYAPDVPVSLVDVAERYSWESAGLEEAGQWFRLARNEPRPGEAPETLYLTPLLGLHQIENGVTAVAMVEALSEQGLVIPPAAVHAGLAMVEWPGRLERIAVEPWLVVDGAHNEESVERVLESLPHYFPHERLIAVVGVLGDKQLPLIAQRIAGAAHAIVATQPDHPRARPAQEVAAAFEGWDGPLVVEERSVDALAAARQLATSSDLICVFGSLFLAAEARAHIQKHASGSQAFA